MLHKLNMVAVAKHAKVNLTAMLAMHNFSFVTSIVNIMVFRKSLSEEIVKCYPELAM